MQIVDVLIVCCSLLSIGADASTKPRLTLDEFFQYTDILSVVIAPTDGQSVLIRTKYRNWNESVNEFHLYLYSVTKKRKFVGAEICNSLQRSGRMK